MRPALSGVCPPSRLRARRSFEEFKELAKKFPNLVFPAFSLAGAVKNAGMREGGAALSTAPRFT